MFGPTQRYDFGPGSRQGVVTVEARQAGVLLLPTGRLVASTAQEGLIRVVQDTAGAQPAAVNS